MRTWQRKDGVRVTLSGHSDGMSVLRLFEADGRQVFHIVYDYWQRAVAEQAAEAVAQLIGADYAEEHPSAA